MEWGIYADTQGTDLAVHRDSFTTFPISSVAKRVEEQETGWFEVFVDWVGERLSEGPAGLGVERCAQLFVRSPEGQQRVVAWGGDLLKLRCRPNHEYMYTSFM